MEDRKGVWTPRAERIVARDRPLSTPSSAQSAFITGRFSSVIQRREDSVDQKASNCNPEEALERLGSHVLGDTVKNALHLGIAINVAVSVLLGVEELAADDLNFEETGDGLGGGTDDLDVIELALNGSFNRLELRVIASPRAPSDLDLDGLCSDSGHGC